MYFLYDISAQRSPACQYLYLLAARCARLELLRYGVPLVERRGVLRAVRDVLSVHWLSPPVGGRERSEQGGARPAIAGIHPRTEPPQSGVPAPLGACLFAFKKRGDLFPPFLSFKALKTLKPFLGPFCPTAPRASGRVHDSKDEFP